MSAPDEMMRLAGRVEAAEIEAIRKGLRVADMLSCDVPLSPSGLKDLEAAWAAFHRLDDAALTPASPSTVVGAGEWQLTRVGDPVTLHECPAGPFEFNGGLGFKTEYGAAKWLPERDAFTVSHWPDPYCLDSGEAFWGGVSGQEARAALVVQPLATAPKPASEDGAALREMKWRPYKLHGDAPIDGSWFVARTTQKGWAATRIVHYAHESDRLPIDHSGWAWPSVPTEWMPLAEYAAALAPAEQPVEVDVETTKGHVICHCSEDDGIPDVGVSIGLGGGKSLWLGELLKRDGADIGFVLHGPDGQRDVAPIWPNCEWQDVADMLRHHVAPALSLDANGGGL